MDKHELLTVLDGLSYPQRMATVCRLGRDLTGTAALGRLLDELNVDDLYEGTIRLHVAVHGRDAARAAGAMRSASRGVRYLCVNLAMQYGFLDDEVEVLLFEVAPMLRRRLYTLLRLRCAPSRSDALLPEVETRYGVVEAACLLAACSPDVVAKRLPDLAWAAQLRVIASRHPDTVLDFFDARLQESPTAELWDQLGRTVEPLAMRRPARLLEVVDKHSRLDTTMILAQVLGRIYLSEPLQTLDYLLAPRRRAWLEDGPPNALRGLFARMPLAHLERLGETWRNTPHLLIPMLRRVSPRVREALFRHLYPQPDVEKIPTSVLVLLPSSLRYALARARLDSERARAFASYRLEALSLCAPEVARPTLEQASRSPIAEDRAHALARLVQNAALSRRDVSSVLQFVERALRNEGDNVRLNVLLALSALPPSLLGAADAPVLSATLARALDVSAGRTLERHVQAIALRILRAPDVDTAIRAAAVDALRRLHSNEAFVLEENSLAVVPSGREREVVDVLYPAVVDRLERNDARGLKSLVLGLGRRARFEPRLEELLEKAVRNPDSKIVEFSVPHWLAARNAQSERVRRLLAWDPSVITLDAVWDVISSRETDLLDRFLRGQPLQGRFAETRRPLLTRQPIPRSRWLPRQLEDAATLLKGVVADSHTSADFRGQNLVRLAGLPNPPLDFIASHLSSHEAALRPLVDTDSPAAVMNFLAERLDAFAALPLVLRLGLELPPADCAEFAARLMSERRIAARKAGIRMIAELRLSAACSLLSEVWRDSENLGMRMAVLQGARRLLDHEEAWNLLAQAASESAPALALEILRQRLDRLPPDQQGRYLQLVLPFARHVEMRVRRAALLALQGASPRFASVVAHVAMREVVDLEGGIAWSTSVQTLLRVTQSGVGMDEVIEAVRRLRDATDVVVPHRDQPARQRLQRLISYFLSSGHARQLRELRQGATVLAQDGAFHSMRVDMLSAVDFDDLSETAEALAQAAVVAAERPLAGVQIPSRRLRFASSDALTSVAERLAARPEAPARRLAVRLLKFCRGGWSDERLAVLRQLRQDENVDVQGPALALYLQSEDLSELVDDSPLARHRFMRVHDLDDG